MLEYRDVIEIPQFQQVGADNRETETNHNDEAPIFDEEKEDQEIREKNEDNEFKFSSYLTSKFSTCEPFIMRQFLFLMFDSAGRCLTTFLFER